MQLLPPNQAGFQLALRLAGMTASRLLTRSLLRLASLRLPEMQPHRSVHGPDFLLHVVHQQVLAKGVGRGEVGFAAAHFGDFLDEAHKVRIPRQHEGIDENA